MKISSRQPKGFNRSIPKTEVAERLVQQMDTTPLSRLRVCDSVYKTDLIDVARKSGNVNELFEFAQGFLQRR